MSQTPAPGRRRNDQQHPDLRRYSTTLYIVGGLTLNGKATSATTATRPPSFSSTVGPNARRLLVVLGYNGNDFISVYQANASFTIAPVFQSTDNMVSSAATTTAPTSHSSISTIQADRAQGGSQVPSRHRLDQRRRHRGHQRQPNYQDSTTAAPA